MVICKSQARFLLTSSQHFPHMIETIIIQIQIKTVVIYEHSVIGWQDSNSNTPPEAQHPQNEWKRILIVITDITVNGSEFNRNIFIGSENTMCAIDHSVCLVVHRCENERVIGAKCASLSWERMVGARVMELLLSVARCAWAISSDAVSVATVVTDAFQKNWTMVSVKLLNSWEYLSR